MIKLLMAITPSTLALAATLVGCASHGQSDPFAFPPPQGQYVATEGEQNGKVEAGDPGERLALDFKPGGKVVLSYDDSGRQIRPIDGTYVYDGYKATVRLPQRTVELTMRKNGSFTMDTGSGILLLFQRP